MTEIKNILLIGRTGNGKSTLANVLVGVNEFNESGFAVSETKKVQVKEFEDKESRIKYRVIDTVGIGDTNMTLKKVLRKLVLMGYSVKDGLSQILFVTDGRLANEAKLTYDLLEKVVFDENISRYTTIVRTRFSGFEDEEKCEKERIRMIESGESLSELVKKSSKVIFVDNPPIDSNDGEFKKWNTRRRDESRKKLLEYLKKVCQDGDVYKPANLTILGGEIGRYMAEKEKLKREKGGEIKSVEFPLVSNEEEIVDSNYERRSSLARSGSSISEVQDSSAKKSKNALAGENVSNLGGKFKKLGGAVEIVGKGVKKTAVVVGVNKIHNEFLNTEITNLMLERIGEIDIRLKENIEGELKKLVENKEEDPADWRKLANAYQAMDDKSLKRIKIKLDKQIKKVEKEFSELTYFYFSKGKLDKFLHHLPEFYLGSQENIVEVMRNDLKENLSREEARTLLGKKLRILQIKNQQRQLIESLKKEKRNLEEKIKVFHQSLSEKEQIGRKQKELVELEKEFAEKSLKLSDYTSLTQKSTKEHTDKNGNFIKVTFNESFQDSKGKSNTLYVSDEADEELKSWTIGQSKAWVLNKFLKEEVYNRNVVKKEDIVDPNSHLFTYLNTLQELEFHKSLLSVKLDDYQRLTKQKNNKEGRVKDSKREWREILFNEKFAGKENKELNFLTFYKDGNFSYLWDDSGGTVLWLRKTDLLTQDATTTIFDSNNASQSPIPAKVQQILEIRWKEKTELQQKVQELQNRLNELIGDTFETEGKMQMEAKVQVSSKE